MIHRFFSVILSLPRATLCLASCASDGVKCNIDIPFGFPPWSRRSWWIRSTVVCFDGQDDRVALPKRSMHTFINANLLALILSGAAGQVAPNCFTVLLSVCGIRSRKSHRQPNCNQLVPRDWVFNFHSANLSMTFPINNLAHCAENDHHSIGTVVFVLFAARSDLNPLTRWHCPTNTFDCVGINRGGNSGRKPRYSVMWAARLRATHAAGHMHNNDGALFMCAISSMPFHLSCQISQASLFVCQCQLTRAFIATVSGCEH